jgi:AcrR family transcriptional regulator
VLATAARMFFERGYAATTTQDIGSALGLLKGSIYYYISSKEELLYEIIEQYHDDTRVYFERILESDAKPLDKLRELITVETAHTASNLTKSSLFYTEWRSLSPERQRPILVERARHENAVEQWIRAAQSAGASAPTSIRRSSPWRSSEWSTRSTAGSSRMEGAPPRRSAANSASSSSTGSFPTDWLIRVS